MQNPALSREDAFSVVSQVSVCIDVTIERDWLDPKFRSKGGDRRIPVCHGGLRQADLILCQRELPPPFFARVPGRRPGQLWSAPG